MTKYSNELRMEIILEVESGASVRRTARKHLLRPLATTQKYAPTHSGRIYLPPREPEKAYAQSFTCESSSLCLSYLRMIDLIFSIGKGTSSFEK